MNKTSLKLGSMLLTLLFLLTACTQGSLPSSDTQEVKSYAHVDFTQAQPVISHPDGSSAIERLTISSLNSGFDPDLQAHQIKKGDEIKFDLQLFAPTMMQVVVAAPTEAPYGEFDVFVNTNLVARLKVDKLLKVDNVSIYKFGAVQIERSAFFIPGKLNTVTLRAIHDLPVKGTRLLPRDLYAKDGRLATTIYSQFAGTDQVTGAISDSIWTRAYGLTNGVDMIPGPTLHFKPGDLLEVNMVNMLNQQAFKNLHVFDSIQASDVLVDEGLTKAHLHGEFNVPHNLNNTNLHVHGLHVDPSKDDVTIVIVPVGESAEHYDAPSSDTPVNPVADPDALDRFSVADQSVKAGIWNYQYKIPPDHLPGTHWFHPHKHGATSAQVENGMAGTIVIEEDTENAIIEHGAIDLRYQAWKAVHDRVLAIQEITNYGVNFGEGDTRGKAVARAKSGKDNKVQLDLTINGKSDYQVNFQPGQLERWRVVNAGTNHRAFSHVWLGKHVGKHEKDSVYQSVPIYLVATDGITQPKMIPVTAERPALLAPGNRTDFLVKLEDPGTYVLFKNYAVEGVKIINHKNDTLFSFHKRDTSTFWPYVSSNKHNPYLFASVHGRDTATLNYLGFQNNWLNTKGKVVPRPVVPNMKVRKVDDYFLDVDFATVPAGYTGPESNALTNSTGDWAPIAFGVAVPAGTLLTANVFGIPDNYPPLPSPQRLKDIAPVTSGKAPAYASPIVRDSSVLQSRPVMFDVSGIGFEVVNHKTSKSDNVNQFTLNGRFFELNDPIGNLKAPELVKEGYKNPAELEYDSLGVSDHDSISAAGYDITFSKTAGVIWPKNNKANDGNWYFVNPSYYQTIQFNDALKYNYYDGRGQPSWEGLTGIDQTAIVNVGPKSKFYQSTQDPNPSLPRAQSAEEWLLVNNSDVSHPFHIHINPFFVVEVGQLSYELVPGTNKFDWYIRSVLAEGEKTRPKIDNAQPGDIVQGEIGVDGIVGNWWDTIVIPAHGFVRVRYWFNVPEQVPDNSKVNDNVDRVGIWVYHCHILRHEDRGMMMPVITQKLKD